MSTSPQPGARTTESNLAADPDIRVPAPIPAPQPGDPLQLLRDAIDRLKRLDGALPDQTQVANLLAEARDALERTNVIALAVAQCDDSLKEGHFDRAFEALDAGLAAYPDDLVLFARRWEVEQQKKASDAAKAVRTAIEEANWLVDQDRIDMAVQRLREKTVELPAQPALIARLQELEILLPRWERKRDVQAALERSRMLEESQQWRAALAILEETSRLHPAVDELNEAAERVRGELLEHERKKKLARRLELIGQKITAQSWKQALTLAEETHKEFPDCLELGTFRRDAEAGLRSAERESAIAEVRQFLADGELEQAEQVLRRALEFLGPEAGLEALRAELASQRAFREELGRAQILFAQRQFAEAEQVLTQPAVQERSETRALLLAVRKARSAAEEEDFCEEGRKKAEELIHEDQFAQAVDLLHNLLSLFPGNPILERDLAIAKAGLDRVSPAAKPSAEESREPAPAATPKPRPEFGPRVVPPQRKTSSISRRVAIGAAVVLAVTGLVLIFAIGLPGKLSRQPALASTRADATVQPPAETPPAAQRVAQPSPGGSSENVSRHPTAAGSIASNGGTRRQPSAAKPPRQFIPAAAKNPGYVAQESRLPAPPPAEAVISTPSVYVLPAELVPPIESPAPPPPAAPRRSPPLAATTAERPPAKNGPYQEAQVVERTMPQYPELARQLRLTGTVRMEAWVDERGFVREIKVLSGQPMLAAAARSAVLKWRYKPATIGGQAIATTVAIEIMFRGGNQ